LRREIGRYGRAPDSVGVPAGISEVGVIDGC